MRRTGTTMMWIIWCLAVALCTVKARRRRIYCTESKSDFYIHTIYMNIQHIHIYIYVYITIYIIYEVRSWCDLLPCRVESGRPQLRSFVYEIRIYYYYYNYNSEVVGLKYDTIQLQQCLLLLLLFFFFFINLYIHIHNATIYISSYCNVFWPTWPIWQGRICICIPFTVSIWIFFSTSIYIYIYTYINETYTYFDCVL